MPDRAAGDDRPRYRQIADLLREGIEAGDYPLGSQLPTESDLCEAHGISRHTVREALRLLAEAGLIQRRQGSGSLVIATRQQSGYVHSMRSLNELFQYASDTTLRYTATGMCVPGPDYAADLGPGCDEEWLRAEGLRIDANGQVPLSHVVVLINRIFAAIAPDLSQIKGAIYAHIERVFDVEVAEVGQLIRIERAPPETAAALGLRARSMVGRVTRRYLDADGRVLLVSINHHPAERFSYAMRLRREGPRGGWG